MADKLIKITQIRSLCGSVQKQRATVRALGLHRRHHTVIKKDTPQIRGMVNKVKHLVHVEAV